MVLDGIAGGKSVYRQYYGVLGFQSPRSLGVRLEGALAFGFAWLSADLTYRFGSGPMRPYGIAGLGLRIDMADAESLGTAGAGLQYALNRTLALFAECRLQRVLANTPQRTFLPITVGVSVGLR